MYGRAGDSPAFPLSVGEDGRVLGRVRGKGPPSIIRQDIPRRRERLDTSIRTARVQASPIARPPVPATSAVPRNPCHVPLRIIRTPVNGARTPQFPPLTPDRLWLTNDRPSVVRALHADDLCPICVSVKSHSVWAECGHGYCYVCIRVALESSWECPEPRCKAIMYRRPSRNPIEEEKLAALYPNREDKSVVNYSFEDLVFPKRPSSP
ncbi:hypothetical protein DFH06DRAFT_1348796 [Mycena polygramma]|nr:hypothetical protein DFH06DRAFT_1348796 [Mycena polygramma]